MNNHKTARSLAVLVIKISFPLRNEWYHSQNFHRTTKNQEPRNHATMMLTAAILIAFFLVVVASDQPTVYLHIGPSKTGTTYIQSVLSSLKDELAAVGVCWPGGRTDNAFHPYAGLFERNGPVGELKQAIDACLAKGQKVLISSEHFSFMHDYTHFHKFFSVYNVMVIAFHREYLTKVYSHYTQRNKIQANPITLKDAAFELINERAYSIDNVGGFNVIHRFQELFGRENMTIYDYDGILAAQQDIAHVMLCHSLSVFCEQASLKVPQVESSNRHPDMIKYDMLHIVHSFVKSLGCRICPPGNSFQGMVEYYANMSALPENLPITTNSLSAMRPVSEAESLKFREEFGDLMRFNSHTASMAVRDAFEAVEVDEHEFFDDPKCTKWLRDEVAWIKRKGWICECDPTSYFKFKVDPV